MRSRQNRKTENRYKDIEWTYKLGGCAWLRIKCKHARRASIFPVEIKY